MYSPIKQKAVWVRLLRPEQEYPIQLEYPVHNFIHRDALYYSSEKAVFIVTKRKSTYAYDSSYHVAIWLPEEIQLLGALTLSVPEGSGMVVFAPWYDSIVHDMPISVDLSSDNSIKTCLDIANNLYVEHESSNKSPYNIRAMSRSEPNCERDLFEHIDPHNGLLTRGLYTLMKSQLLMRSYDFMEEAFMDLQVSREAALQLIREHLKSLGNPNASYSDVHNYIRLNFLFGEPLVDYLEQVHEQWIETKHPLSIYGAEWAPPVSFDDISDTYGCLVSIYRHIILGESGRSTMLQ